MITTHLPLAFVLLMNETPMELFRHGGPVMWPMILLSFVAFTAIVERLLFIVRENGTREPEVVERMLEKVEARDIDGAIDQGKKSQDYLARVLVYALGNKEHSLNNAFVRASNLELNRYQQGLSTLDTIITAAPLLGLLGTVTGMMRTFGSMTGDISSSAGQITGGVAEALIATACGLFLAICTLLPYNYMNQKIETAKHDIEDASDALELLLKKSETTPPFSK